MSAITVEKAYVHSLDFMTISRETDNKDVDLVTMRVRIDRSYRSRSKDSESPRWNREKDFWIDVQLWGSHAKALQHVIGKGASILMTGRYDIGIWEDDGGVKHNNPVFRAFHVAILPWCIESITYKSKDSRGTDQTYQPSEPGSDEHYYNDPPS